MQANTNYCQKNDHYILAYQPLCTHFQMHYYITCYWVTDNYFTAQNKLFHKDFFSKSDRIRRKLRI